MQCLPTLILEVEVKGMNAVLLFLIASSGIIGFILQYSTWSTPPKS